MKRKASISHDEATVRELRENPEFAAEYLRAALEDDDEPVSYTHLAGDNEHGIMIDIMMSFIVSS